MSGNHQSEEQLRHERLCAYLFDELDARERGEVEAELARDADYRVERERLEATIALVRDAVPAGNASDVLSDATRGALSAAAAQRQAGAALAPIHPWPVRLVRSPLTAAAAVLLALGGIAGLALHQGPPAVGSSTARSQSEVARMDLDGSARNKQPDERLGLESRLGRGDAGEKKELSPAEPEADKRTDRAPTDSVAPVLPESPQSAATRTSFGLPPFELNEEVSEDATYTWRDTGAWAKSAPDRSEVDRIREDLKTNQGAPFVFVSKVKEQEGQEQIRAWKVEVGAATPPAESSELGVLSLENGVGGFEDAKLGALGYGAEPQPDPTRADAEVLRRANYNQVKAQAGLGGGGGSAPAVETVELADGSQAQVLRAQPGSPPLTVLATGSTTPPSPGAPGPGGDLFDRPALERGAAGPAPVTRQPGGGPAAPKAENGAAAGGDANGWQKFDVPMVVPETGTGTLSDARRSIESLGELLAFDERPGGRGVRQKVEFTGEEAEQLRRIAELQSDGDEVRLAQARAELVMLLDRHDRGRGIDRYRPDDIVSFCRIRPHETPSAMFFRCWGDNPFELAALDKLSTFAADVDTASYALARNYLSRGIMPTKAQIRTEEFVNSFDSGVVAPAKDVFGLDLEMAPSLFGSNGEWMLRVVVRGKNVDKLERPPLALTFVVDTSGSMKQENRMELVKHALRLLVGELDQNDAIAIVAFSTEARLVLPMTSAGNKAVIESAIFGLNADGSTNAEAGLMMGYAQAAQGLTPGANNRVVMLSDGVANVGNVDEATLLGNVALQRSKGIYLNTIGVGMGNHNDALLEQLADKGDGICNYIDTQAEAVHVLVDGFTGQFVPIARDVKIQVEFDPAQVQSYRLLGYENRAIADAQFRDDKVDAGEVGAGHQVTALYEIVRSPTSTNDGPLAIARVRYKPPFAIDSAKTDSGSREAAEVALEIAKPISFSQVSTSFQGATVGYQKAALVAQLAEFLRKSVHARTDSYDRLATEAIRLEKVAEDPAFTAFTTLVAASRDLIVRNLPPNDAVAQAIDELTRHNYLQGKIAQLQAENHQLTDEILQQLQNQNADLEQRILELLQQERR